MVDLFLFSSTFLFKSLAYFYLGFSIFFLFSPLFYYFGFGRDKLTQQGVMIVTNKLCKSQSQSQCPVIQQKGDVIYYKEYNDFIYIDS